LYGDKAHWHTCQSYGVDILHHCYSSSFFSQALMDKLLSIYEELNAHRQQNFQGGMLKHHRMKSTKYMSLWIEEKNKQTE
jgi:hypothetical protein